MTFLALAIQDDVFEEVHTLEEILFPEHPPTVQVIELTVRPSKRDLPVAREEKYNSEIGWFITSNALKYSSFRDCLNHISLEAGFSGESYIHVLLLYTDIDQNLLNHTISVEEQQIASAKNSRMTSAVC